MTTLILVGLFFLLVTLPLYLLDEPCSRCNHNDWDKEAWPKIKICLHCGWTERK